MIIAPSILASDFTNLQQEIEWINESEAGWFHIDVMDGAFVPNISFGFPVTQAIQKHAKKPLDFHLMINNPDQYLGTCIDSGAEVISVHLEACNHLNRTIEEIKKLGAKAGVAINPHTPVSLLSDILYLTDLVLVMSVNPGFGGQKFIENTYQKVQQLKELANAHNPELFIEIDGGVDLRNAKQLKEAGANVLVAGSSIFKSENPKEYVSKLKAV